ncbi:conserved protein of unknown function [Candidatus Filomicrobium marinum]|uniref:Uncharacterized protein n=2 Tax=Filomicrobium TaxID=119044 RepID=A0A0D6JLL5_9HYPH|nr:MULTISPECIES: DUF4169 family protein [Filomicrobium]MCV0369019.1 DUF4169 family protein [Filomicrobium sp.]CFX63858.1 conserved protein of unknown function [Candidatus Filomicrobium marinum]CPR22567.1 conserved protein of unknown function [Candidatus Filomicrobium marinum]SDO79777.1 protein of unknown function [Filomicrobium insigne]
MTAEIINLRQVRKARERARKEAQAEENRAKFGQSKTERQKRSLEAEHANRQLDGAQRVGSPDHQPSTPPSNPKDDIPPSGGAA